MTWADDSLRASVLELFADAQHLGDPRKQSWTGCRVWRAPVPRPAPPPPPEPARMPFVVPGAPWDAQRVVGLHLAPLASTVVRRCPCGGYWELRPGCTQETHVGVGGVCR
jgi:hypothetical protein